MRHEKYLHEATRKELLRKSRKARGYTSKIGSRWTAKDNSSIANTVKDYNNIDMDKFWKKDDLIFIVKTEGETDTYNVTLDFTNILPRIREGVKNNKNLFEKKILYDALVSALNSSDVKISCTCGDFIYRMAYQASKHGYKAGAQETRSSDVTNPNDDLGAGCKHVLYVLNNAKWIRNIASVINNYVNYAKDHMEHLYSQYIFPKIYGMSYDKAVQMTIDDYEDGEVKNKLNSSPELINLSNALGKDRGKIKKGSNKNPVSIKNNK